MSALFANLGGKLLAAAILLLAAAALAFGAARSIDGMVSQARLSAIAERDAHWSAEIAKSNTDYANRAAAQARAVIALQAKASDDIAEIQREKLERRKDNEGLPDTGTCGISASRGRLLIR